jgi:hypothetical protein
VRALGNSRFELAQQPGDGVGRHRWVLNFPLGVRRAVNGARGRRRC